MRKLYLFILIIAISFNGLAQYATEIVVDKSGQGDFTSIQEAIYSTKAFPEKDITIYVKNGVYREKVTIFSWNNRLTLKGESTDSTRIVWADHFASINLGRNSTFHTFTLKVEANDVRLQNLTIINSSGPIGQAIALYLEGDRIQLINCSIQGHQDTVYTSGEGFRQYFKDCYISGTTDFIFGGATVIFENCTIVSRSNSYITAASTPKSAQFGMVFLKCRITKMDESVNKVYLGRPWRSYAKTAFIECYMENHILPVGWHNWGSTEKETTVSYAEYASKGPGAHMNERAMWATSLTPTTAANYQLEVIFNGWIP